MKIDWRKRVFVVTWLAWCYLVVGCQTAESTTLKPILSPVPAKSTSIPVLLPTPTSEPVLTATSTSSPWRLDISNSFLFYGANKAIYFFQPGNESIFIADGYLLGGQPWSPDGTEFIFNIDKSGTTLATLSGSTAVAWSADGKKIVYAGEPLCILELETLSSNCLSVNKFTIKGIGEFPSWSADNRWLAVRVQDPEKDLQCYMVYVIDMVRSVESRVDLDHCFYGPIYWSR
jgi:hypothetical protein